MIRTLVQICNGLIGIVAILIAIKGVVCLLYGDAEMAIACGVLAYVAKNMAGL